MKQYDRIYIPNGPVSSFVMETGNPNYRRLQGSFTETENVIVLTIEEAQDLWNAAQDRANALQLGDPGDTKIFEAYLESKGVTL